MLSHKKFGLLCKYTNSTKTINMKRCCCLVYARWFWRQVSNTSVLSLHPVLHIWLTVGKPVESSRKVEDPHLVNKDAPSADIRNLFIRLDQVLDFDAETFQRCQLSNRHKWIRSVHYIKHWHKMLPTSIFYLLQSLFGSIWEKTRRTHSFL